MQSVEADDSGSCCAGAGAPCCARSNHS